METAFEAASALSARGDLCTSTSVNREGPQGPGDERALCCSAMLEQALEEGALFSLPELPAPVKKRSSSRKLTEEEKTERARLRKIEQDAARVLRAQAKAQAKADMVREKIAEAEGGRVKLPALVLRDGTVAHLPLEHVQALLEPFLPDLGIDVENSGYPLGHRLYELRTIQLGGEHLAVVLDAADPEQMAVVSWALHGATWLYAHSASVEAIATVHAGLITWDEIWAKLRDSVLYAKLIDPTLSGSDADALKQLAVDLHGDYAVSREAEKAKNELFKAMGCLVDTEATTLPERNGWYMVSRFARTMVAYAGSDVLDLMACVRVLQPQVPVSQEVIDSEREFQAECSIVGLTGFHLDFPHVKAKIAEHEESRARNQQNVLILSGGTISNPSSPDVGEKMLAIDPTVLLATSDKTGRPSAAKASLAPVAKRPDLIGALAKSVLAYRHDVTTLGLLLKPFEIMCEYGDSRMRPTVYTIEAVTGRCSCRRPNGQQLSRRGGIRACVDADPGYLGISADFSGCEIRVAAALSGDRQLLEAETSPFCYKCERDTSLEDPCPCGIDQVKNEVKGHAGLHWLAAHLTFGQDATKEHRYKSKAVIFRHLFGGQPEDEVAQEIAEVFNNRIAPTYAAWDKWLRKCYYDGSMVWRDYTEGQNYSTPVDGSRRLVYEAYSGRRIYVNKGAHAAGNGAIQGTARELLKDGVLKWRRGPWRGVPILPVHDQVLAFVPEEESKEATAFLRECMETRVLSAPGIGEVFIGVDTDEPFEAWPDSS